MDRLTIEMHCHTSFSHDGNNSFEVIIETMRRRSINVVCITDHDTVEGAYDFQKYIKKRNLDCCAIAGVERTLGDGSHIIALFAKEHFVSRTLEDFLLEASEQRAVVTIPHPFRRDGVLDTLRRTGVELRHKSPAIEIFNPKCSFHQNSEARAYAQQNDCIGLGGSDAHYPGEIGECIVVTEFSRDIENVIRGLYAGELPFEVYGVYQEQRDMGRKYIPLYYKIKPTLAIPRPLVSLLKAMYSEYKTITGVRKKINLEKKNM